MIRGFRAPMQASLSVGGRLHRTSFVRSMVCFTDAPSQGCEVSLSGHLALPLSRRCAGSQCVFGVSCRCLTSVPVFSVILSRSSQLPDLSLRQSMILWTQSSRFAYSESSISTLAYSRTPYFHDAADPLELASSYHHAFSSLLHRYNCLGLSFPSVLSPPSFAT